MCVVTTQAGSVLCCQDDGSNMQVDTTLVGEVAVGDWLLVYKGAAREQLEPERALQIQQALAALVAIQQGEAFEHLFADLIEREPQLPEHLRS